MDTVPVLDQIRAVCEEPVQACPAKDCVLRGGIIRGRYGVQEDRTIEAAPVAQVIDALGVGQVNRIGIDSDELNAAAATAARFKGHLIGLHIYVGTNFQKAGEMLPTLEAFFDLAAKIKELSYVNIGGGIGVNYAHDGLQFDLSEFCRGLDRFAERLRSSRQDDVDVLFEPGRGLTAECGTFVTSVTDIKPLAGQWIVAVDGSVSIFPRPLHHPDSPHRIRHLRTGARSIRACSRRMVSVVGRTTFSRDILGTVALPEDLQIGDFLAFDDAGAYSQSMMSRFLGQPDPMSIFLDE